MTNPIWVVKVRMFTTQANDPAAYRSLWRECGEGLSYCTWGADHNCSATDGLSSITRTEGLSGLYRGTTLALVGVSNGAIQFMAYEEMKRWGFERKRKQFADAGKQYTSGDDKLVSFLDLALP